MKKYIHLLIYILVFLLSFSACNDDTKQISGTESEISIYFTTKVPEISHSQKRAVNETLINNINILVFEDAGSGYQYSYIVSGYSLSSTGTSQYEFYARLSPTTRPLKLYLLANAPTAANGLVAGYTEEEVKELLVQNFTPAGFDGTLPMVGELEFAAGITEDSEIDAVMVRSVARVDVQNTADNFTMTSIQVYRANNLYQIIPNELVNNIVTTASVPSESTKSVNTTQLPITGTTFSEQIYLPESTLPASEDRREATVVVIGGIYGTDTAPTYYRMDFVPDDNPELFGQILRNHRYLFTIGEVLASGWRTPDEAAENISSQITAEVKVWNESTVYMEFDDVNYFGVSSRTANVAAPQNSLDTIQIDTNLTTYQLYWTDGNGNIDTSIAPITLGDSFTDPDSVFTVSISINGNQIIFESNTVNDTGTEIVRYLRAEAGRLRIDFTVVQETLRLQMRPLNILGSRNEIGSLGDQVFGSFTAGDRTRNGLVPLLNNLNNFGPNGIVPIESVIRGAQSTAANIPIDWANFFDVLYLTYANNPDNANSDFIINWVGASSKRVIIVQHDNLITNNNLLIKLGIPQANRTTGGQTAPYVVYSNPPTEIMNGVFGNVPSTLQYRSFDDVHGAININTALSVGATPILVNNAGNMVLGVDLNNRIVYCGDIDLYNATNNARAGERLTGNGIISNDADRLIANLFAWIATIALTE